MKISLIGPVYPYRGGIAHFTTLFARQLAQTGNNIQVVSFKKQYPAWLFPGKSDKDYSKTREKVDAEFIINPFNPLSWHNAVKSILSFHPQKVIIPWWVTVWGPCFHHIISTLKRHGISTDVLVHNVIPHEDNPIDRWITKWTLTQASHFVVMTSKEKERLQNILAEPPQIDIVPHPIYQQFTPTMKGKPELRNNLGLPEEKKFVLFFGIIRPYKGLLDLIEAFKLINEKDKDIHLIIAGEYWDDREKYIHKISDLGLQNIIHLFDYYIPDDEAAQFFEAADLFVAPYTGGTQSGAVKSALGFGMPVIITDIIADDLLLELPDICKVVPKGSPQSLAEAIKEKISEPTLDPQITHEIYRKSWNSLVNAFSCDKIKPE